MLRPELVPLLDLEGLPTNAKAHDLGVLHVSLDSFGFLERIVINEITNHILSGHGRRDTLLQKYKAQEVPPEGIEMNEGGGWLVPVDYVSLPENKEDAAAIMLNKSVERGGWEDPQLLENLQRIAEEGQLASTGYEVDELDELMRIANSSGNGTGGEGIEGEEEAASEQEGRRTLASRFIVPPFTVLDARQGYWQERKRAWLLLGIESELGRGGQGPGGSLRPAAQLTDSGRTVRGDGYGKPIRQ